jgi:uncharacterized protein YuzE
MIAKYDAEVDILTIRWSDAPIDESDEDQPGIIIDYDADGKVVGVEVLNASTRIENLGLIPQAG